MRDCDSKIISLSDLIALDNNELFTEEFRNLRAINNFTLAFL